MSYAQNREDVFILELFSGLYRQLTYCELGAGDGTHFSNCRLLREHGWEGISIDADNHGNPDVIQAFITRENIISLIGNGYYDLISIDLDGNDFWILEHIVKNCFSPAAILIEINSQIQQETFQVINYDPDRFWDGSNAYGMNFAAACELLMKQKQYKPIKVFNNTNVLFVKDIIKTSDIGRTWSHPDTMPEGSYWEMHYKEKPLID